MKNKMEKHTVLLVTVLVFGLCTLFAWLQLR